MSEVETKDSLQPSEYWTDVIRARNSYWESEAGAGPLTGAGRANLLALDEELAEVDRLRLITIRRRNDLSPSSSLPDDMLAYIFKALGHMDSPGLNRRQVRVQLKDWTVVTFVCKRWRRIALQCASLWATLDTSFTQQQWELYLQRSGSTPLFIDVQPELSEDAKNEIYGPLITQNSLRLRHLSIALSGSTPSVLEVIISAPQLDQLIVVHLGGSSSRFSAPLPLDILTSKAPNLRVVKLHYVPFPWTVTASNLRSLEVIPLDADSLIPDVLKCLRRMPLLEKISFSTLRRTEEFTRSWDTDEAVALPNLRDITLNSSALWCWSLWHHLLLHPTARINLVAGSFSENWEVEHTNIASLLSHHIALANAPAFIALKLAFPSKNDVRLGLYGTDNASSTSHSKNCHSCIFKGSPAIHLKLYGWSSVPLISSIFFSHISMASLRYLFLVEVDISSSSEWTSLLSSADSLTDLLVFTFRADAAIAFLRALSPSGAAHDSRVESGQPSEERVHRYNQTSLTLPSLDHLVLGNIDFLADEKQPLKDLLGQTLIARQEAGSRLRKLSLHWCLHSSDEAHDLECVAGDVEICGFWEDRDYGVGVLVDFGSCDY